MLLIGFVICTGWLADPNLLSLHRFYKGRLSRAYLGASNTARNNEEITDAAPGDDITLTEVWNHDAGAPYHLVNTTLSLVGGSSGDVAALGRKLRDVALSLWLGPRELSLHRRVHERPALAGHGGGRLGCGDQPEHGLGHSDAAFALLRSLFNVRLGFWAPTPSGRRWREPHARLWPFYVLRETLSNTGQMGTYCYLTDGGHFDNTGLYALIEEAAGSSW